MNGYAGNRDLVARFCPEIAGATYFGGAWIDRRGGAVGREAGAGLANMAAYQGHAAVADPHGSLVVDHDGEVRNLRSIRPRRTLRR